MRKWMVASALFATTLSTSVAVAQQFPDVAARPPVEQTGSQDVAVVVAVEDYAFLPDVPGAARNAADWEEFLSDGLGVGQVFTLTNQQAVREEILAFADKAAKAAGPDGTVWFVFIGHGGPSPKGDDGLLIGADGQQNTKSMAARGLPQKDLLAALEKGKQARTVVVIDACFSGRDQSGGALAKGTMPVLAINPAPKVASSTVIMTAAKADEFAGDLPGAERPAFSYLLLGAMRGWGDDGDGEVTADEAVKYARRELMGISGRQQTPEVVGGGGVVLTRGATEAAPDLWSSPKTVVQPDVNSVPNDVVAVRPAVPESSIDGIPDNPFYARASVGPGVLDDFGSLGVTGDFGVGVKLNGFKKTSTNEWRLGLRFSIANTANSSAPEAGETSNDGAVIESNDTIEDQRQSGWIIGPEIGKAWRSESGPGIMGDSVFAISLLGLYGNMSQCNGWTLDTSNGRRFVCDTAKEGAGPGGGLSLGGHYGPFYMGALLAFVVDIGAYASATVGLTYDL